MKEDDVKRIIKEELSNLIKSDRYTIHKLIQMLDGRNFQFGLTTGTKIGTATTQKIGLYGVTPVVQAGAISAPTGGGTIDSEARTAINSIRTALTNIGITA